MLVRLLSFASAPREVVPGPRWQCAVSGPHHAAVDQFQGSTIVVLTALGIEFVWLGCDVAEKVQLVRPAVGLEGA